jgi:hypothetical protein
MGRTMWAKRVPACRQPLQQDYYTWASSVVHVACILAKDQRERKEQINAMYIPPNMRW